MKGGFSLDKKENLIIAVLILIVALASIIVLRQAAAAEPLAIYGTTDWSSELNPRLTFLKIVTSVQGDPVEVILHHSPDNENWKKTRMRKSGVSRYTTVMPNNQLGETWYFVRAEDNEGNVVQDPEEGAYIASVPFKAFRKSIKKSQDYEGKKLPPMHRSFNYGNLPVIFPIY